MRGLYRFYLYGVFILLSGYATYVCSAFLAVLLRFTFLRASYETVPSSNAVVQASTFALVSFLVVGLIGGLHYWLIRRDIAQDAEAGTSAVRSFFLNATEGIAAAVSLPLFGWTLLSLATTNDTGSALSFTLSVLALTLLLELERRRIPAPERGAGATFLRIHIYGVQIVLLIVLASNWSHIILSLIDSLLPGLHLQAEGCPANGSCAHVNLFFLVLAGLWFAATWFFYSWLSSHDTTRFLRFISHLLGFAVGTCFILLGLYNLFHLILALLFREQPALSDIFGLGAHYDFLGPLTLGLLLAFTYHRWLRAGNRQGLLPIHGNLYLMELATISILAAATFWLGTGTLLYNTFALLLKFPQPLERQSWISAGALVLAGCGSIGLEFYLRRKNQREPRMAAEPRRAQVFFLLAIGTTTFSIAIATTLYIVLTTALGSPIANWAQVLSFGLATLLVGLPLAGFYFYTALNEHLFARTPRPQPFEASTQEKAEIATIETILSQLLANKLTRAEASEQLYKLMQTTDAREHR